MKPAVVIPTLDEGTPRPVASIPHGVEVYVVREGNRSEARNLGVERSRGSPVIFCDDDIAFDTDTFWRLARLADGETVAGLEDYDFGLALTRFMAVERELFEAIGGFDERLNHMEDTEFCLRALAHGATLETVPRTWVDHADHDSRVSTRQRLRTLAYVLARHPVQGPRYLSRLGTRYCLAQL